MLIDSHCHLYLDDLSENIDAVLERASEAGVEQMICPALDVDAAESALALARKYANVFAAVGVHPNYTSDLPEDYLDQLRPLFNESKVVAGGEIGLDYYRDYAAPEVQRTRFA